MKLGSGGVNRVPGPAGHISDGRSEPPEILGRPVPVRADQNHGKRSSCPPAEGVQDGLLLMDSMFRTLAVEQGVESRLMGDRNGFGMKPALSIPLEFQEAIRNARPAELSGLRMTVSMGNVAYQCRVSLLHAHDGLLPRYFFALHLRGAAEDIDRIGRFSAAYHLTSREEQALRGIAEGLSSKELADKMGINPNTVKSFLRLVMIKLGVRRRGEVLAKLFNYDTNTSF